MKKKEITVFTPTYNREKELKRLYENLCKQTNQNFCWLIIDDGSSDGTKEYIKNISSTSVFEIEYRKVENHGKQRATNIAIELCETEFFAFLDSDDFYLDYTIEYFYNKISIIKENEKVAGICARRGYSFDSVVGNDFSFDEGIINIDYLIRKFHMSGDTCRLYKTNVLKQFKYPIISDKFIGEDLMLSAIDQEYDMFFLNKVLSITEYKKDGYTKNIYKIYNENPTGRALSLNQLTICRRGLIYKLKIQITFNIWKNIHKDTLKNIKPNNKFLYFILYPVSKFLFIIRKPDHLFMEINK